MQVGRNFKIKIYPNLLIITYPYIIRLDEGKRKIARGRENEERGDINFGFSANDFRFLSMVLDFTGDAHEFLLHR